MSVEDLLSELGYYTDRRNIPNEKTEINVD